MFTSDKSMFDAFKKLDTDAEAEPPKEKPEPADPEGPDGPVKPPPVLRCSDCRVSMFQTYFALSERPVCAKCRQPYAKAIAYGRGPRAIQRALRWGGGTALGAALVFGGISMTVPFVRHLLVIGIAFGVTKAIMAATKLGGRAYQWMAVCFTYGALGLGSVIPVACALDDKSVQAAVEQQRKNDAIAKASPLANAAELTGEADRGADAVLDARRDIVSLAENLEKQVEARRDLAKIHVGMSEHQKQAQVLLGGGKSAVAMGLIMTFLFAPFVGLLSFGLFSAGVGLLMMIFALYKAWKWTEVQVFYELSGPHRVGAGPIPPLY
ncbi:MAG TPA: hypothetical protein VJ717_02060 [Gemmatimonadaceae bacterium]|nr:hypothetical protein [Gemmatimonadaceae bacterium]